MTVTDAPVSTYFLALGHLLPCLRNRGQISIPRWCILNNFLVLLNFHPNNRLFGGISSTQVHLDPRMMCWRAYLAASLSIFSQFSLSHDNIDTLLF